MNTTKDPRVVQVYLFFGGNCEQACKSGATCEVSCVGGNCKRSGTIAKKSCLGGNCTG